MRRIAVELENVDAVRRLANEAVRHGATLVPMTETAAAGEALQVCLSCAGTSEAVELGVTVLQVLPGHGVAAALDSTALQLLSDWVASFAAPSEELVGETPEELESSDGEEAKASAADGERPRRRSYVPDRGASDDDLGSRYRKMTQAEKIQAALHGSRELRGLIARDSNRALHQYLLRSPHLGLDEVQAMARIQSLAVDALVQIARHDTWGSDPTVCTNLVHNPKLPPPVAVSLLGKVPRAELKRIAQGIGVRELIARAAARLLGKLK